MEGIPESPGDGYRPELYTPRLGRRPPFPGIPSGTWLEAQHWTAILLDHARFAGGLACQRAGTSPLALPSGWIGTRLFQEAHALAVYAVTSVACAAATFDGDGADCIPELDAISGVTSVDGSALLHRVARRQREAIARHDWDAAEEGAAELAYVAAEFGRCARVFILQSPPPRANHSEPVYYEALVRAYASASAGATTGDPASTRLVDVLGSALVDLQHDRVPLAGLTLPLQLFHGHKSAARGLQAHTEVIEDHVLPSPAARRHREGAAGGALLRVALAVGAGDTESRVRDALGRCWYGADADPRPMPAPDGYARRLALRAVAALDHDSNAPVAAAKKATTRANHPASEPSSSWPSPMVSVRFYRMIITRSSNPWTR